jgi:hypothetical protein
MSTRATYQFDSPATGRETFYIHHDGYFTGAAGYFRKAFESSQSGTLAEKFFRANENAKFTSAAENHDDTEFHYTVSGWGKLLVAYQRRPFGSSDELQWVEKFRGSVKEFVNYYNPLRG